MSFPPIFAGVRKRPEMHLQAATYEAAASYLLGYDAALNGGLLVGFHQWLVTQLDWGDNLGWPALVQELMNRRARTDDPYAAIEFLFGTVETFMRERDSFDGLRKIFVAHEEWLRERDSYAPTSPRWIPPSK